MAEPIHGKNTLKNNTFLFILLIAGLLHSCVNKEQVDSIYYNGFICTMDDKVERGQAQRASVIVIKDGKIVAVGDSTLLERYTCGNEHKINLNGRFVMPGLIDAHCHFHGYARTLLTCNLVGTKSWEEVISKVDSFSETTSDAWIKGRGWDQNDWTVKAYPTNKELNLLFPDRPVILKRIDGHAAICNAKALALAGITNQTKIKGGEVVLADGQLTGVLVDNAVDSVEKIIPQPSNESMAKVLKQAEKECLSLGLTTLADAGLDLETCLFLDSLGRNNQLSIYLYMMLNPTEKGLQYAKEKGVLENDHSKICSFKLYADGALGSRGAKLKQPYCDRPGHSGMLLNDVTYFDYWCGQIKNHTTYQVNTHCIGDSANRLLLEVYGKYLKGKNDERWRIEHAQVIDPIDFPLFKKYSIIPSVQPTHATSDGPWVTDRICNHRKKGAYAYQTLYQQNGYLPLGTDFPVEYLNPLFTYYSAVFRLNANQEEQPAFEIDEQLTPFQAVAGMTIFAAKACRLEQRKGSITVGKDADFIVLNQDLFTTTKDNVLNTKVLKTVIRGKELYNLGD